MRLILISLSFLILGCSGFQQVSSPAYVPLNSKKGDLKANIFINHVQLGYSVGKHISVFATGFRRQSETGFLQKWGTKEGGGSESYEDKSAEINFGASYFTTSKFFRYEVLVGTGMGYYHYKRFVDDLYNYNSGFDSDTRNIFIQPSISFITPKSAINKHLEFGVFTKITNYQYYNIKSTTGGGSAWGSDLLFTNVNKRDFLFAEPGVCVRAGASFVKGNVVVGVPVNLQGGELRYKRVAVNLSAFFSLNLLRKQKQ